MTEDDNAKTIRIEAIKQKAAATRERHRLELAERQRKIALEKPGYRIIARGSQKGQLKWMGLKQQRIDEGDARTQRWKEAARLKAETSVPSTQLRPLVEKPKASKVSPEVVWAFLFIVSVSLIFLFIARLFAAMGIMGLAVLIDALCYQKIAMKSQHSRYLPFLWWLF